MFDVALDVERRADVDGDGQDDGPLFIVGYAARFDKESQDLGGFAEVIRAGAFARAIAEDDVRALWNHDDNFVLGRTKSGTLRLSEDAEGLRIEIELPDTTWARDLYKSIERGDVDQMSFAFRVVKDAWTQREGETPDVLRELLEVRLYDVSPVTYPAYLDTEVKVRDLLRGRDLSADEERAVSGLLGTPRARSTGTLRRRLALMDRA